MIKMKKLNRKGFTLIELLAIIVILAIIMVVTIPSLLDVMDDSVSKQFKNSADAIEKWVADQYTLASIGSGSTAFTAVCGNTGSSCTNTKDVSPTSANGKAFLTAAGQKPGNYSSVSVEVKTNGRVCVIITANTETGDFSGVGAGEVKSNGCS